jgi:hypothetical protein
MASPSNLSSASQGEAAASSPKEPSDSKSPGASLMQVTEKDAASPRAETRQLDIRQPPVQPAAEQQPAAAQPIEAQPEQAGAAPAPAHATSDSQTEAKPDSPPSLTNLVQSKGQRLNMVDRTKLIRSIDESVVWALGTEIPNLTRDDLVRVTLAVRNNMMQRLKNNSQAVRGVPQSAFLRKLVATRNQLLKEHASLSNELTGLRTSLEEKQREFTASQEELVRKTTEEGRAQDHAFVRRVQQLFAQIGSQNPEMARIQEEVVSMVLLSVNQERQKLLDSKASEHQAQVEMFERRIAKLNESLGATESELRRIAAMKGIDPGVSSIYRSVQGLSLDEDQLEAKRGMLENIFNANLELKKHLAESR